MYFKTSDLPKAESIYQETVFDISEIYSAMSNCGLYPKDIMLDGKIHRFNTNTQDKKSLDGWYSFNADNDIVFGGFGCWRDGVSESFFSKRIRNEVCEVKRAEFYARIEKMKQDAIISQKQKQAESAKIAYETIANLLQSKGAVQNHPYLVSKKIKPLGNGLAINDNNELIVPIGDIITQTITSYQSISCDGTKKFLQDGEIKGMGYAITGTGDDVFVCEGYATACTIHEQTGKTVYIAFNAGNIPAITEKVVKLHNPDNVTICADNDLPNKTQTGYGGAGLYYANQAKEKFKVNVILCPEVKMDFNDYFNAGKDIKSLLVKTSFSFFSMDDLMRQCEPQAYLIDSFIPKNALGMLYGASGSGKSFVGLDMALSVACGTNWQDTQTESGMVAYIAGEGHNGFRSRVTSWSQEHGNTKGKFFLSKEGEKIDTTAGYNRVIEGLDALPEKPSLIFLDTLHSLNSGDENSAKDASAMIEACNKLKNRYDATVILVHHTGLGNDERARGSSAWRGAMDFEYLLKKNKDDDSVSLICKKMKDDEAPQDMIFELKTVELNGWFKKNGEPATSKSVIKMTESKSTETKEAKQERDDRHFKTDTLSKVQPVLNLYGHRDESGDLYFTKDGFKQHYMNDPFAEKDKIKKFCEIFFREDRENRPMQRALKMGFIEKKIASGEMRFYIKDVVTDFVDHLNNSENDPPF